MKILIVEGNNSGVEAGGGNTERRGNGGNVNVKIVIIKQMKKIGVSLGFRSNEVQFGSRTFLRDFRQNFTCEMSNTLAKAAIFFRHALPSVLTRIRLASFHFSVLVSQQLRLKQHILLNPQTPIQRNPHGPTSLPQMQRVKKRSDRYRGHRKHRLLAAGVITHPPGSTVSVVIIVVNFYHAVSVETLGIAELDVEELQRNDASQRCDKML